MIDPFPGGWHPGGSLRKTMFDHIRLTTDIDREFEEDLRLFGAYGKLCGFLTLEMLFTTDSVYCAACRCASGFMGKADTWYFMRDAWENSRGLCGRVLAGKYKPKYYKSRTIRERGKERVIRPPAFECKVVQKVLCDYLVRPLLEMKMVSTCYASVKGRGTDKMYEDILDELNRRVRYGMDFSVATADFVGYFAGIDTGILIRILSRYIRDGRIVRLVNLFSPDDMGLSLGNEMSQIPASFFPSLIDHEMKDRYGIPLYRYMDDSLAVVDAGKEDWYISTYQTLAGTLRLECPDRKFSVYPAGKSFVFCKERFAWNGKAGRYDRLINPKIVSNERRKLKAFEKKIRDGVMEPEDALLQYGGVIGSIKRHPHTYMTVQELEASSSAIRKYNGGTGSC